MFDFSQVVPQNNSVAVNPIDIFRNSQTATSNFRYLRDVQLEVLSKFNEISSNRDFIIKMNTGSGKTIVGLLILKSFLNQDEGSACYVVPDNYLVNQVIEEAKKLGIDCTNKVEDPKFLRGRAIFVTNISKLINGKTVFGISNTFKIDYLLIDDAQSCFNKIKEQFNLKIYNDDPVYENIIELVKYDWKNNDLKSYNDFENKDPLSFYKVPFDIWQDHYVDIQNILQTNYTSNDSNNNLFKINLVLNEGFRFANCVITTKQIEISSLGIDLSAIKGISKCRKRLFLSATLADDSVFSYIFGSDFNYPKKFISPENANDIGCRLILAPQFTDTDVSDEDLRDQILSFSKNYNVSVIVPSFERALFWDPDKANTVTKDNITEKLIELKNKSSSLTVFVNRYDGIDLKDDMCRIIVIDSLPPARSLYDEFERNVCSDSLKLLQNDLQLIEQGLGRAVRANNDYCCAILMGKNLIQRLSVGLKSCKFTDVTQKQFDCMEIFDRQLFDENGKFKPYEFSDLICKSLENIGNVSGCLRASIYDAKYDNDIKKNEQTVLFTKFWLSILKKDVHKSEEYLQKLINNEKDKQFKGLYTQLLASLYYNNDRKESFKIQRNALNLNSSLPKVNYINDENDKITENQAKHLIQEFQNCEDLIKTYNKIREINFLLSSDNFELLISLLGKLLGFESYRPDNVKTSKKDGGPDNLWYATSDDTISYVIECKNRCQGELICKDDANQLRSSVAWFANKYSNKKCVPILFHKSNKLDKQAVAVDGCLVVNEQQLKKLVLKVGLFISEISPENNFEKSIICFSLRKNKLQYHQIFNDNSSSLE